MYILSGKKHAKHISSISSIPWLVQFRQAKTSYSANNTTIAGCEHKEGMSEYIHTHIEMCVYSSIHSYTKRKRRPQQSEHSFCLSRIQPYHTIQNETEFWWGNDGVCWLSLVHTMCISTHADTVTHTHKTVREIGGERSIQ